jgi:hypothetical protein
MTEPVNDPAAALASAVLDYRRQGDVGALLDRVRALAANADPDALLAAARPYHELAEVVIPVYERVVSSRPNDAQAMVVLANAYWLTGRGSEVVGQLASRAIAADAHNRGAWHLWALAEPDPRARTARWQRVVDTFPADQLARAALADNATSLAGAEHDPLALDLAVRTYESLWAEAARPEERRALEETIAKLKGWTL